MRFASVLLLAFFLVLVGCSGASDGPARPDLGTTDSGTDAGPGADSGTGTDLGTAPDLGATQELSATLTADACGNLHAAATVDVPAGSTVTICAGSHVTFDAGAALRVHGTLHVAGTSAARVTLDGTGWSGLIVNGMADVHFTDVTGASVSLTTFSGATTTVEDSTLTVPNRTSLAFRVGGGATIDRTRITGGTTSAITGGMLSMTDSTIDLGLPLGGLDIDCTHNDGGGVTLDHVLINGCHCPLHFNHTDLPVTITNTILGSVSADPIMIAHTNATVHHSALLGTDVLVLDIGGGVTADVAGNWWGGPTASTFAMPGSTITGTTDVLTAMPTDVGPR